VLFDERALFYATNTHANQIPKKALKRNGEWFKKLRKTYAVQFVNYDSNNAIGINDPNVKDTLIDRISKHPMKKGNFMKWYVMTDKFSGQEIDHLQMIQVELPRAAKAMNLFPPNKDFTTQQWWLSILCNSAKYTEEFVEELYKEGIMQHEIYEALGRIKYDTWNPSLKDDYKRDLAEIREFYAPQIAMDLNAAKIEGIAIGEKKGIAIGEEKGKAEKAKETALKLLSKGMDVRDIAEVTGLSRGEITSLMH
jgi:hypothetical protein